MEDDISRLIESYSISKPLMDAGTLYVPGTRRWSDYIDDAVIPLMPFQSWSPFAATQAVRDAEMFFADGKPERVVGHSLGGAVAAYLGSKYGVFNVGYGSPVPNDENYADYRDPVGTLVGSSRLNNPQSIIHHGVQHYRPVAGAAGVSGRRLR